MMMKEDVHLDVASTDGAADLKSAPSPEEGTSPPDLSLMKLASSSSSPPDMDTLIIQTVPTGPASLQVGSSLSSQLLYQHHKTLTEEQEFAEGFVKALEDLHKQNQLNLQLQPGPVPHCSVDSSPVAAVLPDLPPVYTSLTSYATSSPLVDSMVPLPPPPLPPPHHHHHHHHHHHPTTKMDEPQTVPDVQSLCGDSSSPPPSPANGGEVQDRIKAERKRLRNRIAATKCRKRKLERISRLEDKVQSLKEQNTDLGSTASVLRQQVERLKQKVLNHVDSGCQVTVH